VQIPTEEDADSIRKNAEKIISHVESGVKIAKMYNLPEEIVDMISEHHGTTRALYFYGQAKEKGLKIKKTDFKYAGPVPQSKESAILMLSDCVEATTRSMSNLATEQISDMVDKLVKERVEENQFKNCSLKDKDLDAIKVSLKENLRSIYHQRIEYNQK
jgi:membrane-associated HD superfamily phosphohydrolase